MHSTEILDEDKKLIAAVDYYFIQEDGERFKVSLPFNPYLYILIKKEAIQETVSFISKKFGQFISKMEQVRNWAYFGGFYHWKYWQFQVTKEDLDLANHLIGIKQTYTKISFQTTNDLTRVKIS